MDLTTYQHQAARTLNPALSDEDHLLNFALGLIGELGELADEYKKHKHQGHELRSDKVIDEAGDMTWYIAGAMNYFAIDLSRINILPATTADDIHTILLANNHVNALSILLTSPESDRHLIQVNILQLLSLLAALLATHGTTLNATFDANINKLRRRYPDAFSTTASIKRTE